MLQCKRIDVDFCVVGGGLAGLTAAIAAARRGIQVALIQERPVLGGNASSEIRMWISGAQGKGNRETGILEELELENMYRNPTKNFYLWDTVLYDFVKREKNIKLFLNATCMEAECERGQFAYGRNVRIKSIKAYQMTTQTFWEVYAKNFADCSGDSILAPLTGAEFRWGREGAEEFGEEVYAKKADKMVMGMSCLIQARETTQKVKFTAPLWSTKLSEEDVNNRSLGSVKDPTNNYWYLELGGDRDTIHETEEIKDELLKLALGAWDHIKNHGEDAENFDLEFLGFLPGKRESRRMCGEYIVTQTDIMQDTVFEDTVAYGGWPLDDHFPGGFYHKGKANFHFSTPAPYCLPYRALYSKNVENLFFAGRNISMTHAAMSSIRVMATCALLGQAVGTAAALASRYDAVPHLIYEKYIKELQEMLMEDDCFLPHFQRKISDACKEANIVSLTCNGEMKKDKKLQCLKNGEDRANRIYNTEAVGVDVENNSVLKYQFKSLQEVESIHIVFDSDLDRETLPGHWVEAGRNTRANVLLDSPQTHMPKTLCREFMLEIETEAGREQLLLVKDNRKRTYHVSVNKSILGIALKVVSNWGEGNTSKVISFDFR